MPGMIARHGDPLVGLLGPPTKYKQGDGLYEGLHVAAFNLGNVRPLHPSDLAARGVDGLAGYGTSFDDELATARAAGEAVERYCSVMYPVEDLVRASAEELGRLALGLECFPQSSPGERRRWTGSVGLRAVNRDTPLRWVAAFSLVTGRRILVPLEMAYIGLPDLLCDLVKVPVSTGFAAGPDFESAVLGGLLEVIERDAVALWWWGSRRTPHLARVAADVPGLADFDRRAAELGVTHFLLDLTTDVGAPVVASLQLAPEPPHLVFMSAARLDRTSAAVRAVEEVGAVRHALAMASEGPSVDDLRSGLPARPVDFAAAYAVGIPAGAFDFAISPTAAEAHPEGPSTLDGMCCRLADLGYDVLVVDCTTSDVAQLGMVVVRVIVPGMVDISFTHAVRYLGERRIREVLRPAPDQDPIDACHDYPLPFA